MTGPLVAHHAEKHSLVVAARRVLFHPLLPAVEWHLCAPAPARPSVRPPAVPAGRPPPIWRAPPPPGTVLGACTPPSGVVHAPKTVPSGTARDAPPPTPPTCASVCVARGDQRQRAGASRAPTLPQMDGCGRAVATAAPHLTPARGYPPLHQQTRQRRAPPLLFPTQEIGPGAAAKRAAGAPGFLAAATAPARRHSARGGVDRGSGAVPGGGGASWSRRPPQGGGAPPGRRACVGGRTAARCNKQ